MTLKSPISEETGIERENRIWEERLDRKKRQSRRVEKIGAVVGIVCALIELAQCFFPYTGS